MLNESRPGDRVFEAPLIDANYGWGERIQLKVEVPWIVRDAAGEPARGGLGNVVLGVKWRFLNEETAGIAVGVYPQLEINSAASSARAGLVGTGTVLLLPLVVQKNLGVVSANLELEYQAHSGAGNGWFAGLAFGREVSEHLELLGEVFVRASVHFDETEAGWNAGAGGRWQPTRSCSFRPAPGSAPRHSSRESGSAATSVSSSCFEVDGRRFIRPVPSTTARR